MYCVQCNKQSFTVLLLHTLRVLNILKRGSAQDPLDKYIAVDATLREFKDGRHACYQLDRDIAQVNSQEENNEVQNLAKGNNCSATFLGRGFLSEKDGEQRLVQVSYPKKTGYTNYAPGTLVPAKNHPFLMVDGLWRLTKTDNDEACTVCGPAFDTQPGEYIKLRRAWCQGTVILGTSITSLEDCKTRCSENNECFGVTHLLPKLQIFVVCEILRTCTPYFDLSFPEQYDLYVKHKFNANVTTTKAATTEKDTTAASTISSDASSATADYTESSFTPSPGGLSSGVIGTIIGSIVVICNIALVGWWVFNDRMQGRNIKLKGASVKASGSDSDVVRPSKETQRKELSVESSKSTSRDISSSA